MQQLIDVKQLGNVIRKTRKQQGLTQAQLGALCEVGIRFLRELEQGKETCQIGKALHVTRMLGIRVQLQEWQA